MSSFNRKDYEKIYHFAAFVYAHEKQKKGAVGIRVIACEIMDMCEDVIGQQTDRPDRSY
jgi:hypothetical protein